MCRDGGVFCSLLLVENIYRTQQTRFHFNPIHRHCVDYRTTSRVKLTPMRVRKAVITAAGRGTRMFPATRAIQKEMLPIIDQDGKTRYGAVGFDPKDRPKDKFGRMVRHLLKIKE